MCGSGGHMFSTRILIIAHDGPDLRRARERLQVEGYESDVANTAAAGLLFLGRLQPDIVVLDPLVGRGRPEDWRRGIERYREGGPLAVILTTDDPFARRSLADLADLGILSRAFDVEALCSLVDEFDDDEEFRRAG